MTIELTSLAVTKNKKTAQEKKVQQQQRTQKNEWISP